MVITAGGTREPIDAVRFIGNRSSGKMGVALARAAFDRGATVDLVKANIDLPLAPGVREVDTPTADGMYREVMRLLPDTDILIMAAAVADYEVVTPAGGKIGKSQDEVRVSLAPTTDILCEVALAKRPDQFVVGFAAEYGIEGLVRAREKLVRKRLDMIVFNDISRSDIGFNSDYNEVHILTPHGETQGGARAQGDHRRDRAGSHRQGGAGSWWGVRPGHLSLATVLRRRCRGCPKSTAAPGKGRGR